MRITPAYIEQNRLLHDQRIDYGQMGHQHLESVRGVAQVFGVKSVLDYGCGKQTLLEALRLAYARGYDPCIPGLDAEPVPADMVICTDVLEHIEPECIEEVLDHLKALTKRVLFATVSLRPAKKTLPDGRNTHILLKPAKWWLTQFIERFEMDTCRCTDTEIQAVLRAFGESAKDTTLVNNIRK